MSANQTRFWGVLWIITHSVAILLLAAAVAVPRFVKARWSSSGVPVVLNISVADAQTAQPIPGAKVVVWINADWDFPVNETSVGDVSATTDAQGNCEVHSHFPGSGRGNKGRLRVNSVIWIRAEGYEPCQQPSSALLGRCLTVSGPSQTNSYPLKILMNPNR